ncbi:hypothetical protein T492DRAFT_947089 [Pavlovales sp. CCMP2436]|nr:hypothetical protein T492DRAFT_947089 [Pavlovales sp. CCMP2436]
MWRGRRTSWRLARRRRPSRRRATTAPSRRRALRRWQRQRCSPRGWRRGRRRRRRRPSARRRRPRPRWRPRRRRRPRRTPPRSRSTCDPPTAFCATAHRPQRPQPASARRRRSTNTGRRRSSPPPRPPRPLPPPRQCAAPSRRRSRRGHVSAWACSAWGSAQRGPTSAVQMQRACRASRAGPRRRRKLPWAPRCSAGSSEVRSFRSVACARRWPAGLAHPWAGSSSGPNMLPRPNITNLAHPWVAAAAVAGAAGGRTRSRRRAHRWLPTLTPPPAARANRLRVGSCSRV